MPVVQWPECAASCRAANPGWGWVFWTDADNERLFKELLPRHRSTYRRIKNPVARADFSRFAYMFVHG